MDRTQPERPADAAPAVDADARGLQLLIAQVRAQVAGFAAHTARERDSKRRFLDELERLPDPFSEHADPVHVTGSAIICGPRGTVLHLHKRLHRWMQTGGHVDPGETPWDAALRESREETGLPVTRAGDAPHLVHLDVHPAARGHTHLDLRYLLISAHVEPAPPPGESEHVRWFSWDEARALADEALVDAIDRLRPPRT